MKEWGLILAVGLFGSAGAMLRYQVSAWAQLFPSTMPWGTLIVNVGGCFLLGGLATLAEWEHLQFAPGLRVALAAGFLGALTTFSTFGLETLDQFQRGSWKGGVLNILLNVGLGLLAVGLGRWGTQRALDLWD